MSVLKDLRRASHHSPQDGKQFCWNYLDQTGAQLTVISGWVLAGWVNISVSHGSWWC